MAAVLLCTGGILVATSSPASADIISSGGVLSLDASPGVLTDATMGPGSRVYWPISAQLDASTSGTLSLVVRSAEALATNPQGLQLQLSSCPNPWTMTANPSDPPRCNGGTGKVIIPETAFSDISASTRYQLGQMSAVSTMPLMATISLPETVPASLQGTSATVDFGFTALGDTENASPNVPSTPALGLTGVDAVGPAVLGIGLVLAGLTLGRLRRALSRRADERVAS